MLLLVSMQIKTSTLYLLDQNMTPSFYSVLEMQGLIYDVVLALKKVLVISLLPQTHWYTRLTDLLNRPREKRRNTK